VSERKVKIMTGQKGRPKGVEILGSGARETPVKIISPTPPRNRSEDDRTTKPDYGS